MKVLVSTETLQVMYVGIVMDAYDLWVFARFSCLSDTVQSRLSSPRGSSSCLDFRVCGKTWALS